MTTGKQKGCYSINPLVPITDVGAIAYGSCALVIATGTIGIDTCVRIIANGTIGCDS